MQQKSTSDCKFRRPTGEEDDITVTKLHHATTSGEHFIHHANQNPMRTQLKNNQTNEMEQSSQLWIWRNWMSICLERASTDQLSSKTIGAEGTKPPEHIGDSEDHWRNPERVKDGSAWKTSHHHTRRLQMLGVVKRVWRVGHARFTGSLVRDKPRI